MSRMVHLEASRRRAAHGDLRTNAPRSSIVSTAFHQSNANVSRRLDVSSGLVNLVARNVTEEEDERLLFEYSNGLTIQTEKPLRNDPLRVLPLGVPQAALMNFMLHSPELLNDRLVFEPFAGSGAIGLMSLKAGARRVELLDINPKAVRFQRENAARNGYDEARVACIEGSIHDFIPNQHYDLIFVNPPFVPTPDGIAGTTTSKGGSDGNMFVEVLFERLPELLEPSGQAFVYLMQFVADGRPLIADALERCLADRTVSLTPTQIEPVAFDEYYRAYLDLFPEDRDATERWRTGLFEQHGDDLWIEHYIAHLGPHSDDRCAWSITDDLEQKYGEDLRITFNSGRELAYGRAFENFRPDSGSAR
jgi:hypothetical protein